MKWTYLAISAVFGLAAATAQPQGKDGSQGSGGKAAPPSHSSGGPSKGSQGSGGPSKASPPPQSSSGGSSKGSPPPQSSSGGGSGGGSSKGSPPPQSGGGGSSKGSPPSYGGGSPGKGSPPSSPPQSGNGGFRKTIPPIHGGGVFGKPTPPIQNGDVFGRPNPPNQGGGVFGKPTPPVQGGGNSVGKPDEGRRGGIRERGDIFDRYKAPPNPYGNDKGDVIRRRDPRNGNVAYGSKNNNNGDRNGQAGKIDRAPVNPKNGQVEFKIRKPDRITVHPKWRDGYHHYDRGWDDDCWNYGWYRFRPYFDDCVMSPWYYYHHLPAYLLCSRIIYIDCRPWYYRGDYYRWSRIDGYGNGNYNDLDYAIEDLVQTFERGDKRSLGRLIPRSGRINIAVDGQYSYSVAADDFYEMMSDLTQTTRTQQYRIVDVRRYRDEAQLTAEHVYTDPWGRNETMYHTYRLEQERGGYVIRDFGSSAYRYIGN